MVVYVAVSFYMGVWKMDNDMQLQPHEFWFYAWLIEVKGITTLERFQELSEEKFGELLKEYRRDYGL